MQLLNCFSLKHAALHWSALKMSESKLNPDGKCHLRISFANPHFPIRRLKEWVQLNTQPDSGYILRMSNVWQRSLQCYVVAHKNIEAIFPISWIIIVFFRERVWLALFTFPWNGMKTKYGCHQSLFFGSPEEVNNLCHGLIWGSAAVESEKGF